MLAPTDPATELSYDGYRELLDIGLDGVLVKMVAEKLTEQDDGGVITDTSSLAGQSG